MKVLNDFIDNIDVVIVNKRAVTRVCASHITITSMITAIFI